MKVRYEPTADPTRFDACFPDGARVTVTRSRERGYAGLAESGQPHRPLYELLRSMLLEDSERLTIADAACGSGYGSELLRSGGHEVIGADLSDEATRFATHRYPGCRFVRASLNALPFDDGMFDLFVSIETIEHVEDDLQALAEIRRVLRPQGRLFMTTPATWPGKNVSDYHIREYARGDFEALLIRGGFVLHRWVICGPHFYFVEARRASRAGAAVGRASSLLRSGRPQDAASALEPVFSGLASATPTLLCEVALLIAECHVAQGDLSAAMNAALDARRLDPGGHRPLVVLGFVTLAAVEPERALRLFGAAIAAEPSSYLAYCGAAHAAAKLGKTEKANAAATIARNLAPRDPAVARFVDAFRAAA